MAFCVVASIVLVQLVTGTALTIDPQDVAKITKLVGDQIVTISDASSLCESAGNTDACAFAKWSYGSGIIINGLVDATVGVPGCNYTNWVDTKLDLWTNTKGQNAYDVLHDVTIPWGRSIGDDIGLYPIAYLARATSKNDTSPTSDDIKLVTQVANQYIVRWPDHWVDGTISRADGGHWPAEVKHGNASFPSFIWGDDAFMGLTLVARLAALGIGQSDAFRTYVAAQQAHFQQNLQDVEGTDMLYYHGRNANDNVWSCCKWSRANGWTMMSHMEALLALDGHDSGPFEATLQIFRSHAAAVIKVQDSGDGRWHQLLNDTSTFHETSGTAMFLLSFIIGVEKGYLDKTTYDPVISLAWNGLTKSILSDGNVTNICQGFGIHDTPEQYATASTDYLSSAPGLGTVLRAAAAMYRYVQH